MRHGTVLPGALALLVVLTGCTAAGAGRSTGGARSSGDTGGSHAPVDLTGTVGVRDLHDLFTADRSRAEKECYGQTVTVRAVVLKTGASEYGTPTIEASDVEHGTHLASIVLPYDGRRAESFRRLEKVRDGQEIVASATCDVFADRNSVLIFKNAEIVE
ncbi:hypothetical protein AB0J21_31775 [Streptomyces sp. NPDC049954]|uniref:OB-fold protein n=1 Tax=Streptomyces sp. NPDC049954 TaxID=3155779 RepID=UPI003445F8B8